MSRYEVEIREDGIILRKESENGLLAWNKFTIYLRDRRRDVRDTD